MIGQLLKDKNDSVKVVIFSHLVCTMEAASINFCSNHIVVKTNETMAAIRSRLLTTVITNFS